MSQFSSIQILHHQISLRINHSKKEVIFPKRGLVQVFSMLYMWLKFRVPRLEILMDKNRRSLSKIHDHFLLKCIHNFTWQLPKQTCGKSSNVTWSWHHSPLSRHWLGVEYPSQQLINSNCNEMRKCPQNTSKPVYCVCRRTSATEHSSKV